MGKKKTILAIRSVEKRLVLDFVHEQSKRVPKIIVMWHDFLTL